MSIKRFVAGQKYGTRSVGDHNCIYRFEVVRRTKKTVWITGESIKEPTRRTITEYDGEETIMPFGRYSMAPSLRAGRDIMVEAETIAQRTVRVPQREQHAGFAYVDLTLVWLCPVCGGPRGDIYDVDSFDGSRKLRCSGWKNPCGHVDTYVAVREEAAANGLNESDPAFDGQREEAPPMDLEFTVHTSNLLSEVLNNNSTQILRVPLLQLSNYLRRVAHRSAQLNDPVLNKLMVQLTLYTIADRELEDYDPEAVKAILAEKGTDEKPIYQRLGFPSGWDEHPDYPKDDWRAEVQEDATYLGYWEWLEALLGDTD